MKRTICVILLSAFGILLYSQDYISSYLNNLPVIRYTPLPDSIYNIRELIIDLNGIWNFIPEPEPLFYEKQQANVLKIKIPSQLDAVYPQFSASTLKSTGFFRSFFIPGDWKGNRVKLRFNSLNGLAEIFINGKFVATHNGGCFIPFELDVTDEALFGVENQIAIRIQSSYLSKISWRDYLGIEGDVYLAVVPPVTISRLHINTVFDKDFRDAVLSADISIANEGIQKHSGMTISYRVVDKNNVEVATGMEKTGEIPAGNEYTRNIQYKITSPLKWDNEHPDLYRLVVELFSDNMLVERVSERFGFRQIDVKNREVLINNKPVKLYGINYHPEYPGLRHAMTPELRRTDVEIFRNANINFLRAWPSGSDIFDHCDEIGMFTQSETTVSFVRSSILKEIDNLGQKESFIRDLVRLNLEKIEAFRNHPSVIIWCLGNESVFTDTGFVASALATKKVDKSRPVMADSDNLTEINIPYLDIDNLHYPNLTTIGKPVNYPMYSGEWCHVNNYQPDEISYDPGVRDYWVIALLKHVEYTYNTPGVLGGNIFSGNDFSFDPGAGAGGLLPEWGIIDKWRRPKPEYWHVKKAFSPFKIIKTGYGNGKLELEVENRSNFSNLNELEIEWQYGNRRGTVSPDIPPRSRGRIEIPLDENVSKNVLLTINSNRGFEVDRYNINIDERKPGLQNSPKINGKLSLSRTADEIIVSGKNFRWHFDAKSGMIKSGMINGNIIAKGGPFLVATQRYRGEAGFASNWLPDAVNVKNHKDSIIISAGGKYNEASGNYLMIIKNTGELDVNYSFLWLKKDSVIKKSSIRDTRPSSGNMREIGISFSLPVDMGNLYWNRKSTWDIYPDDHIGRPAGIAKANYFTNQPDTHNKPSWPYSWDNNPLGSNDFRSTKCNILNASLTDFKGSGVEVISDGNQHLHCYMDIQKNEIIMIVSDYYFGGYERFIQGRYVDMPERILKEGDKLEGSVHLKIE